MSAHHAIAKIVAGGQTGAEQGGLDAAIERGVWHGGWCPMGRGAEDGIIPEKYRLVEIDHLARVSHLEGNIIHSHSTLIFTCGRLAGGLDDTAKLVSRYRRWCLQIDLASMTNAQAAQAVLLGLSPGGLTLPDFAGPQPYPVLHVTGARESEAP